MKSFLETTFILSLIFLVLALISAFYLGVSHLIFKTSFNLKSFTQFYVIVLFLVWILLLFSTAMMFGSGNNDDDLQTLFLANFILFYPILISILLVLIGFKIYGIQPKYILIFWLITTYSFSFGFNYPRLLLNYAKGISNSPTLKK